MQEQASNHLKLLWSKVMVVSVEEKSRHRIVADVDQGDEYQRTTDVTAENLQIEFGHSEKNWFTFSMENNLEQMKGTHKTAWINEFIMTKVK